MKHLFLITLLQIIISPAWASTCVDLFSSSYSFDPNVPFVQQIPIEKKDFPDETEVKLVLSEIEMGERAFAEQVALQFLNRKASLMKKLTFWKDTFLGDNEIRYVFEMRLRHRKLMSVVKESGDLSEVAFLYGDIFQSMDLAYFELKNYFSVNPALGPHPRNINKLLKTFGENYGAYKQAKLYLESEANKDLGANPDAVAVKVKERATQALGLLHISDALDGQQGLRATGSELLKRPTVAEIEDFFHSHQEPLIYKLNRDLWEERKLGIGIFIKNTIQLTLFQDFIKKFIPETWKDGLAKFSKTLYNSAATRFIPDVAEINYATEAGRLNVFKRALSRYDKVGKGDFFLETMARLTDTEYNLLWAELKIKVVEQASNPEDAVFKLIVTRMNTAEVKMKDLGTLSERDTPALMDMFEYWIGPIAVPALITYGFNFQAINQAVGSWLGF